MGQGPSKELSGEAARALHRVTRALPGGGEVREGQRQMAEQVAGAIAGGRHLVVAAGTGTGKSLAYLVPAILSGRRVVVATATKALQDQLARRDLPLLQASLGRSFRFTVLKGRANYLCRQRATEVVTGGPDQMLDGFGGPDAETAGHGDGPAGHGDGPAGHGGPGGGRGGAGGATGLGEEVSRLLAWGRRTRTGDRAELDFEPSPRAWGLVSVGATECPGRAHCPSGRACFAEEARDRANRSDVVVVNMHLYGAHLKAEQGVLADHDVVVFDEAHELEDVATASLGVELSPWRLRAVA
ncbi:MAG: ATP-dependent DNA helicase, partial [Acidimicrobiales bacterium]